MFFYDPVWANIVEESFNAKTLRYFIDGKDYVIHVIPYGFFSFAFPNFPIGVNKDDAIVYAHSKQLELELRKEATFLRITAPNNSYSQYNSSVFLSQEQSTTEIKNLKKWKLEGLSSSIRRNVKRAQRNGVQISEVVTPDSFNKIYELYQDTISRHSGKSKYNKEYFSQLLKATMDDIGAFVGIARNEEGRIIGYMIVVDHEGTAYYLHGGIDYEYQNLRVMDALFYSSIVAAQKRGLETFNMLMSPTDQPNLVRYKEKWGGETSVVTTSTVSFNPIINKTLMIASKILNKNYFLNENNISA